MPKTMLVFAHPDDEVIALGARLSRFQSAHFVHVTDGAPLNGQDSRAHGFATLDEYRRAREEELCRALALVGLHHVSRERLEIPDQTAALHLPELVHHLYRSLLQHQPEVIFTHPYEAGHPDHDACAFAVHRAVALLKTRTQDAPLIIECAFYHAGPEGIETGHFLYYPETREIAWPLSLQEQLRKQALLHCFETQQDVLRHFTVECERFRLAPKYDFHKPPHPGPAWYDLQHWAITSQKFCELARKEEQQLSEEPSACL